VGELCDQFLLTPVRGSFSLGREFQFFSHAVERFRECTEIIVPVHVERDIQVAFGYAARKIGELVERSDVEVPDSSKKDDARGIYYRNRNDELLP
jgi:hypothetical protein